MPACLSYSRIVFSADLDFFANCQYPEEKNQTPVAHLKYIDLHLKLTNAVIFL